MTLKLEAHSGWLHDTISFTFNRSIEGYNRGKAEFDTLYLFYEPRDDSINLDLNVDPSGRELPLIGIPAEQLDEFIAALQWLRAGVLGRAAIELEHPVEREHEREHAAASQLPNGTAARLPDGTDARLPDGTE